MYIFLMSVVLWLLGGIVHLIVYLNWDLLILYHFFGAMYGGPGHVPIGWAPVSQDLFFFLLHVISFIFPKFYMVKSKIYDTRLDL